MLKEPASVNVNLISGFCFLCRRECSSKCRKCPVWFCCADHQVRLIHSSYHTSHTLHVNYRRNELMGDRGFCLFTFFDPSRKKTFFFIFRVHVLAKKLNCTNTIQIILLFKIHIRVFFGKKIYEIASSTYDPTMHLRWEGSKRK
jgi:hypothetical protein